MYVADNFNVRLLAPTLAQVIFTTGSIIPPATTLSKPALRSSLWIHDDNRWQIIFHQSTLTGSL